jgi:hypothetical protein
MDSVRFRTHMHQFSVSRRTGSARRGDDCTTADAGDGSSPLNHQRMRRLSVGALLAVALGVAACGSTNTAQPVSTSPSAGAGTASVAPQGPSGTTASIPATDTASTTALTATATPTVTRPTTSAPVTVTTETITAPDSGGAGFTSTSTATSQCVADDLSASAVPPNSAPGETVLGFTLTNTSSRACESGAYPGIGLITASGSVDDVSTTRSTGDDLGSTPVVRIDLEPGQAMSFRITLRDAGSGSGAGCGSYTGVQIIAPNDTATIRTTLPDGPVQSCGGVGVSPVEPGENGTGQ